jgi:AraC-like DNA-binding protein
MDQKILHIKNMVCNRCIKVVREELENLDYIVTNIQLGEVNITSERKIIDLNEIKTMLVENGFELIDNRQASIIERIKILIINSIHHNNTNNLSEINIHSEIEKDIDLSYAYISSLFSSKEGITIEKYIINQKIEKVKELLIYDELTLSEIAYKLDYSSVQHLSNQFKKTTGLSPSYFKKLKSHKRKPLDNVS